jgi:tetratricopeptide (TPR) repeat protein
LNCKSNLRVAALFLFTWIAAACAGPALDSANATYTRGNLAESVKLYKKALGAGENPVLCDYNCANAYFQLDSLAKALMFYRQCILGAPDFVKAHLNLTIIYYMLGDLGRCIASAKETLRLDPDNQKLRMVLAADIPQSQRFRNSGQVARRIPAYGAKLSLRALAHLRYLRPGGRPAAFVVLSPKIL